MTIVDDSIARLNSITDTFGRPRGPVSLPQYTAAQPGPGRKDDNGKPRVDLIPPFLVRAIVGSFAPLGEYPRHALEEIGKVLGFGAAKYGENNWQGVARGTDRYYGAALRHLGAHASGEAFDPESGLLHLAHAGTSVVFKCWLDGVGDAPLRGLAGAEHGNTKVRNIVDSLTYAHEMQDHECRLGALCGICDLIEQQVGPMQFATLTTE